MPAFVTSEPFVPVTQVSAPAAMEHAVPPSSGRMEIVSANGRRVVVDGSVDVEALLRIMRGLETLR